MVHLVKLVILWNRTKAEDTCCFFHLLKYNLLVSFFWNYRSNSLFNFLHKIALPSRQTHKTSNPGPSRSAEPLSSATIASISPAASPPPHPWGAPIENVLPSVWDENVRVWWGNKLAENFRWRQVNPSFRHCGALLWWRRQRFISAPRGWGRRLPTCLWAYTFSKSRLRGVISRHLINIFISMRRWACLRAARREDGGPWLVPSQSRWEAAGTSEWNPEY